MLVGIELNCHFL